jgi:hypothetical protein
LNPNEEDVPAIVGVCRVAGQTGHKKGERGVSRGLEGLLVGVIGRYTHLISYFATRIMHLKKKQSKRAMKNC